MFNNKNYKEMKTKGFKNNSEQEMSLCEWLLAVAFGLMFGLAFVGMLVF